MSTKILIVKTSAIGDVIQTFPVLDYLRKKFPYARIDWVVEEGIAPLLRSHPGIDNVVEIRSKIWRRTPFQLETQKEFRSFVHQLRGTAYDLVFDLQGNAKSGLVTACAKAKSKIGFGWKSAREKCNVLATNIRINVPSDLNIRLRYLKLIQSYFEDSGEIDALGVRLTITDGERLRLQEICQMEPLQKRPRLMICFGSRWENKQLKMQTLVSFLEKIAADSDSSFLFIYGSEEEKVQADQLSAHFKERSAPVGCLSLPLWQALMWEMDGVVAVDSAALHLCATTLTPSFSVFGPSLSSIYKPLEDRHLAVQGTCPYSKIFSHRCPILRTCSTGACIRDLHADALFTAYKDWAHFLR